MKKNTRTGAEPQMARKAHHAPTTVQSTRSQVLASYELESFQRLSRAQAEHVQHLLQHGPSFGTWQTQRDWFEGGTEAQRTVDIRSRTIHFLSPEIAELAKALPTEQPFVARLLDDAVLSQTRYLLLCRVGSVGMGRAKGQSLDPSTVAWHAYSFLPVLAALSIEKSFRQGGPLFKTEELDGVCFARLDDDYLTAANLSESKRKQLKVEVLRMRQLHGRGLWHDSPAESADAAKTTAVGGPASPPPEPDVIEPHLPLPDDYVSSMGRKSVWLVKNLGPSLLRALAGFHHLWSRAAQEGAKPATLSRWCADYLATFQWTDATGAHVEALPFPVKLNGLGHRRTKKGKKSAPQSDLSLNWPPTNAAHVLGLCRTLQGAHMFIVGLSIGARRTELLTLKRKCVQYAKDGRPYADGRTFKLVQAHAGEERDWVLPDMAVEAVEQQARLVSLYERLSDFSHPTNPSKLVSGDHLWGHAGAGGGSNRAARLSSAGLGACIRDYGEALQMEPMPGGQPLRPHRFRKTLARLAALAITQAPKVLQDVFGHKSIEMTLYYILSDKDLMAEIETVARELRIMRAQEVVSDMVAAEEAQEALARAAGSEGKVQAQALDLGGYGGAAAASIQKAVRLHREDVHRRGADWGAADVLELAEILTMQGRDWQLVRPGVLCTKSIGQAGPCNKKKGKPEPALCRTRCDYRLEEAWHREDVDQTIAEAVDFYEAEIAKGEDLVAELWAGQIRAHIGRFADLEQKWMAHPKVRELVLGAA